MGFKPSGSWEPGYRLPDDMMKQIEGVVLALAHEDPKGGWQDLEVEDLRRNAPVLLSLYEHRRRCESCDRVSCSYVPVKPTIDINAGGRVTIKTVAGKCPNRSKGGGARDEDLPF